MTQLDTNTGILYIENTTFPIAIDGTNSTDHEINGSIYSNLTSNISQLNDLPFNSTAYYKNKKLQRISLVITNEYLKENYKPDNNTIDFRDYITPYIEFSKFKMEELLFNLTMTSKRKFVWGEISILIDPKDPLIFGEIKYY